MADVPQLSDDEVSTPAVDVNPLDLSAPLRVLDPQHTPDPTAGQAIKAARIIRRALSTETNLSEVIDAFLELNPLPILRKYLYINNDTLAAEAGWIMTNIAASNTAHCDALIKHNIHEDLCALLAHPSLDVVEQCIWGLGNIAGDRAESRDLLLSAGVTQSLHEAFMRTHTSLKFLNNLAWTVSNICRSKPRPDDAYLAPIFDMLRCALSSVDGASMIDDDVGNEWICEVLWAISHLSEGSSNEIQRCLDYDLLQLVLKLFRTEVDAPGIGEASETLRRRVASEHLGEVLAYLPQSYLVPLCAMNKDVFITSVCDHKEVYNRLRSNFTAATRKLRVPTLRIVGNVLSGTDAQTTLAIEHGAVKLLEVTCTSISVIERRDILWALSNLAGGTVEHALAVVKSEVLLNTVHQALIGTNKTLIREALWVLANLTARDDGRLYAMYPHLTDKVLIPGIALCLFHHVCKPSEQNSETGRDRSLFVMRGYQILEEAVDEPTKAALDEQMENSEHEPQNQKEIQRVVDVLWDESRRGRRGEAKIEEVIDALIGYRHFLQRCKETKPVKRKNTSNQTSDLDLRVTSSSDEGKVSFEALVFFLYLKVANRIAEMRRKRSREEEAEGEGEVCGRGESARRVDCEIHPQASNEQTNE